MSDVNSPQPLSPSRDDLVRSHDPPSHKSKGAAWLDGNDEGNSVFSSLAEGTLP